GSIAGGTSVGQMRPNSSRRDPWRWGHDGEVSQARSPLRSILLLMLFAGIAVATFSALLREDAKGVRRAGSTATLSIPSRRTVHLEARTYAVSYGDAVHAVRPRLSGLHVSIRPAGGGPAVHYREPPKHQMVTAAGRSDTELS